VDQQEDDARNAERPIGNTNAPIRGANRLPIIYNYSVSTTL
jgi:hypothetical protein